MSEKNQKPSKVFVLQAEAASEPFLFEWQGKQYSVPHVRDMDVFGVRDDIRTAADEDAMMWAHFKNGVGDKDWQKLRADGMTQATFQRLVEAWRAHCGLTEGESQASSD